MKRVLEYLKPVIEDENQQPSRKRLLEIMCITTGCVLTSTTCVYKYYHPELDVVSLIMLITPLFVTGTAYSGITSYYQNKLNGIQTNSNTTGTSDSGSSSNGSTN